MTGIATQHCLECGVPGDRSSCQRLFDEILAREFGDFRYGRTHRLTVDAYSLQHPGEYMRSAKSYAAHLTGMYAAIAGTSREANPIVQQWLSGPVTLVRQAEPPPGLRGTLTVAHAHTAVDPDDHVRRVREWADSVWEAWREHHALARNWVEEAGRLRT